MVIIVTDKEKDTIKKVEVIGKADIDGLKAAAIFMKGLQTAMIILAKQENKTA
nr:MAG TPA: hypothetical protein [Caudoviricetes sp.]